MRPHGRRPEFRWKHDAVGSMLGQLYYNSRLTTTTTLHGVEFRRRVLCSCRTRPIRTASSVTGRVAPSPIYSCRSSVASSDRNSSLHRFVMDKSQSSGSSLRTPTTRNRLLSSDCSPVYGRRSNSIEWVVGPKSIGIGGDRLLLVVFEQESHIRFVSRFCRDHVAAFESRSTSLNTALGTHRVPLTRYFCPLQPRCHRSAVSIFFFTGA